MDAASAVDFDRNLIEQRELIEMTYGVVPMKGENYSPIKVYDEIEEQLKVQARAQNEFEKVKYFIFILLLDLDFVKTQIHIF